MSHDKALYKSTVTTTTAAEVVRPKFSGQLLYLFNYHEAQLWQRDRATRYVR